MLSELFMNNKTMLLKTNSYLLPHLNRIVDLTAQLETMAGNDYTRAFTRMELPKGAYLVKAGTVCRHLWVLEKGIARTFACKKGVERNQYFFFPSEIIDSFFSSAFNVPSGTSIQLLEPSVVHCIPRSSLEELKKVYPLISDIEKLMIECHANWVQEHLYNLQFFNAQEHYDYLVATQPHLLRQISQNHLASFMGITRETLSRIRNARFEYMRVG